MLNDSMSCGFIDARRLLTPPTPWLFMAIPSITTRGSLLAVSEEPPRTRICAPPPGVPSLTVTFTPATLPESMSCAVTTTPLFFPSGLSAVTLPVRSLFFTAP